MSILFFIAVFIVSTIVYSIGMYMGIQYYKSVIRNKQSIGILVVEEVDGEPINLYLALDSSERLHNLGSEVILQVKRK